MEGVIRKLRGDVYLRANKHIPPFHPSRRIRREIGSAMRQLILPIKEQLYEDATWKE